MSAHGGKVQTPLPYAFARREEFLRLPQEKRTAHLWEAHVFCEGQLGAKRFPDDELQRNLRVLRRMMLEVAKDVAKKLREDGSWQNAADPRWPSNHKGDDIDHWYDSGAFPPRFLALPEDADVWRQVLQEGAGPVFDEMIAWVETPAGQAGVGDEALQKLLADRDTYLPEAERARTEIRQAPDWESHPADRDAGLEWLAAKSADRSLQTWASNLGLAELEIYLGGIASNRRPIDRLIIELMNLESCGELEKLQRHLDVASPLDAALLARLRSGLPRKG